MGATFEVALTDVEKEFAEGRSAPEVGRSQDALKLHPILLLQRILYQLQGDWHGGLVGSSPSEGMLRTPPQCSEPSTGRSNRARILKFRIVIGVGLRTGAFRDPSDARGKHRKRHISTQDLHQSSDRKLTLA